MLLYTDIILINQIYDLLSSMVKITIERKSIAMDADTDNKFQSP